MATNPHPVTGVQLNSIEIRRKSLSWEEAVTAYMLRLQGMDYSEVAFCLGVNPYRIGEVLRGEVHRDAGTHAAKLLIAQRQMKRSPTLA